MVKFLLKVPGLTADEVSRGLKAPPLEVFSVEQRRQAEKIKDTLEKLGAMCQIEDTDAIPKSANREEIYIAPVVQKKLEKKNSGWAIWLSIFGVLILFAALTFYFQDTDKTKQKQKVESTTAQKAPVATPAPAKNTAPPEKYAKASTPGLKQTLNKNPYDVDAWKKLTANLEKEGDTASAKIAKKSYDQAVKSQMILASLAKAFGNDSRVEIREDAVYYRTSKDIGDREFYYNAAVLRDSLNAKFPNKDLVVENYTSDNKVQTVRLSAGYKSIEVPITED